MGEGVSGALQRAVAARSAGDSDGEAHALAAVLAVQPDHVPALLRLGQLLEAAGRGRHAARLYADALAFAAGGPQSPALAPTLEHARRAVAAATAELEAFLTGRMSDGGALSPRIAASLDVLLGNRRVYVQDPTFVAVPYLPAIEFHGRDGLPWLPALEAATPEILAELRGVLADDSAFAPYIDSADKLPLGEADLWADLDGTTRWGAFYFWQDGQRVDAHCARCPRTAAVLDSMPMPSIPGFAPSALFSRLAPRTRIPPHTGMTNARLIVHLPLVVPDGCGFRVGSQTRTWRTGEAWVFDDTIEHEAWNNSDEERVVLIFDVWNPLLEPAEQAQVAAMIEGYRAFHGPDAPAGGL